MAIEIKSLFKVEVNINGKVYSINKPSLGQQAEYEDGLHKASETKTSVFVLMIKYLVGLGLPEDVAKQLTAEDFQQIVTEISALKKS